MKRCYRCSGVFQADEAKCPYCGAFAATAEAIHYYKTGSFYYKLLSLVVPVLSILAVWFIGFRQADYQISQNEKISREKYYYSLLIELGNNMIISKNIKAFCESPKRSSGGKNMFLRYPVLTSAVDYGMANGFGAFKEAENIRLMTVIYLTGHNLNYMQNQIVKDLNNDVSLKSEESQMLELTIKYLDSARNLTANLLSLYDRLHSELPETGLPEFVFDKDTAALNVKN